MKVTIEYNEEEAEMEGEITLERFKQMDDVARVVGDFGRWFRDQYKHNDDLTVAEIWDAWIGELNENGVDWVNV